MNTTRYDDGHVEHTVHENLNDATAAAIEALKKDNVRSVETVKIDTIYSPCPCGSGKQFKWCHGSHGDSNLHSPPAAEPAPEVTT